MPAFCLRPVQPHAQEVEDVVERQRAQRVGAQRVDCRLAGDAVAQLQRALQVGVAPDCGFRLVAELLQRIRAQFACSAIARLREHDLAHGLRDPAVLALPVVGAGALDYLVGTPRILDELASLLRRRHRIQVGRVGVVPAQVLLVDGLGVVAERSVVAARGPVVAQGSRQTQRFGNLGRLVAVVEQAQALVIDELVGIALLPEEGLHACLAIDRPGMLGNRDLGPVTETRQCLVDRPGPGVAIADLGATDRVKLVQRGGRQLGAVEHLFRREVHHHLGRRLGALREHQLHLDTVDVQRLAILFDQPRRRNQRDRADGQRLAHAGIDRAARATVKESTELVLCPAAHCIARQHVLGDRVLHESGRRDHGNLARLDVIFADHALDAAKMIDVAVRVDHGAHRLARPVLVIQVERGLRRFRGQQRIDDDQPCLALDDGHVRHVEAAHLVDAAGDVEQAMQILQPGKSPQAGIDRGRRVPLVEEVKAFDGPHQLAVGALDGGVRDGADEAALRVGEVVGIAKGQRLQQVRLQRLRCGLRLPGGLCLAGACEQHGDHCADGQRRRFVVRLDQGLSPGVVSGHPFRAGRRRPAVFSSRG
ncbi:hypothetical protein D9M70_251270 [compost metagenome]